ncbi:MAG TPA: BTAD domain-containing putative transcriptional regulator [Actinomycetes bacterium]|nr:BTAD domain-containing putative transcriptional regulator [Actinomycetes bacterium]
MEFRLLGSLEVLQNGGLPVRLGGLKPRLLLAVLLVHANQVVTVEQLVDALWGEEPPATARKTVQYFVHGLRKTFGAATGVPSNLVETQASGYLLRVGTDEVDVQRFEASLRRAWQAQAAGNQQAVAEALVAGLAEWRGPALADFSTEPFLQPTIAQLEEQRNAAVEELAEARLALGDHAELIGELEAFRQSWPLRERAQELLMIALYRSGRQAEALAVYRQFRDRLVEELGLEPGPELRRLEARMLAQDPTLAAPERPGDAAPRAPAPARPEAPAATTDGPADATPPPVETRREERRAITVLVAGMAPATSGRDPEDERARSGQALEQLLAVVSRYGGTVMTVFGGTVLAVFGVPKAREDDPERAVRAALAMCDSPPEGMTIRVGVETGEAVVGPRGWGGAGGGQVAMAGGVSGLVLDVAVKLQSKAPAGGVLAGDAVHRATHPWISYAKDGPPWRPVEPRSRVGMAVAQDEVGARHAPLVERRHELMVLESMLGRIRQERLAQLVTVIGASGIGKTRLVTELARRAERDPELITWRQARSLPYGGSDGGSERGGVVFWALAETVRAQIGIDDADTRLVADAKVEAAVGSLFDDPADAAAMADQLRRLLRLVPAGEPEPDQRQAAFAAWARFLAAVADDRPLVLVFEDLHWADGALLAFVEELVERVGQVPLLVVCTGRPELLEREVQWSGGKPNTATVSLGPLSAAGARVLLDSLLEVKGIVLDPATRDQLLGAAAGNPLFLEEYVRMVRDRSTIQAPLPVPETVHQLITARIDQLDPGDRRLLQDLAVIGEPGWNDLMSELSGLGPAELASALAHLARQELLVRAGPGLGGKEPAYMFRHPLIREVAYGQLVRAERADRHRRVAAWLEAHETDRITDRTELLAHHYEQALELTGAAGQPTEELAERARLAFRAAGDRCRALGAIAGAARSYRAALSLWPEDAPDRAELLYQLGQAQAYGQHSGDDILIEARDAFEVAGQSDRAIEINITLSQLARIRGDHRAARTYLDQALTGDTRPSPQLAFALGAQAVELMLSDEFDEAIAASKHALRLARELDLLQVEGLALVADGQSRLHLGDSSSLARLERGIEMLAEAGHATVNFARFGPPLATWCNGDLRRCAEVLEEQARLVDAKDIVSRWFDIPRATLAYAAGNWTKALELAERYLTGVSGSQPGNHEPWARVVRSQIRLGRGELAGARADCERAQELARIGRSRRYQHMSLALEGRILVAEGRPAEAAQRLDQLLEDQRAHPRSAFATTDQAALMVDLDKPTALTAELPPTLWHQAVRAFAERDFELAAKRYAELGAVYDEAAVRLRAARAHLAAGRSADARPELERATRVFRTAAATSLLDHARRLAAELEPQAVKL